MKTKEALVAVEKARELSKKRKFMQTFELMVNFKGMDMKKPASMISEKVSLPHSTGATSGKILVFAKTDVFANTLKDKVDKIVMEKDIEALAKDKKAQAELFTYDALFAEGPAMLVVAKFLGQQLAPKAKMPKPIMDATKFDEVLKQTKTETTISNKKGKAMPLVQVVVGKEDMKNDEIAENIVAAYEAVEKALPQKYQNVKSVVVKTTMGKPVRVGEK